MKKIKYAGFWIRFVASFADTIVLALPLGVVIYFLSDGSWFDFALYQQNMHYAMSGNAAKALQNQPELSLQWELLFEVSVLVVSVIFWKRWRGATPGKRFVHIKIVDATTFEDITNTQALTRSIAYIASTFTLLLGFFMIGFHKEKKALHDILASTVVIYDE